MGFLDRLRGIKKPAPGVAPKSPDEVRAAILALNRPTAPFTVCDAANDKKADFIAEWRITDATWYEIFAKAGLEKVFKVLMKLDPSNNEVRAVDEEWTVEWRAGVPRLSLATESFRGQEKEFDFGRATAFTEELEYGQVYRYKFTTGEIKAPLQDAVTNAGWTWRGVAFGKF